MTVWPQWVTEHLSIGLVLNLLVLFVAVGVFFFIIKSHDNPLKFWHLIGTRSADGVYYVDNDKVAQFCGLIFGTWVICFLTWTKTEITTEYVIVLAFWWLYCAGMTAFGKFARAFVHDKFGSKGTAAVERAKGRRATT